MKDAADKKHRGVVAGFQHETNCFGVTKAELSDFVFDEVEDEFDCVMWSPDNAIRHAFSAAVARPIIFADAQDNPGAGATSDSVGILSALAQYGARGVLMGLFCDAEVAEAAHRAGVGGVFKAALGGKSGLVGHSPFVGEFGVIAVSDGRCEHSGEMYGGGVATMGATAAVKFVGGGADIDIVVTSIRNQCLDLAHFTHLGLDPAAYRVVVVKRIAHFRAAFAPIASEILSVVSPGAFPRDLRQVEYKNLKARILP